MRLVEFFNAVSLFEAAKDRFAQMFTNLTPMFAEIGKEREFETEVNNEISWAMRVLRKQDKITWYLRFVKVGLLGRMSDAASSDPDEEVRQNAYTMFLSTFTKALEQLMRKMGISDDHQMRMIVNNVLTRGFKQKMEHYMSLELPAIEAYTFSNQTPDQIIADWTPVERAWQQKANALIDINREGLETVIKYPDGSEWVNLNKSFCDIEAKAMGHCGNTASYTEDHTILSYRTLEDTEKGDMWKPRLTFVLDTSNGLLGETKGRANQKPDKKYHNVIIDLLKNPLVKGIKGGGFEAQNNFHLEDLPEETVEALVDEKPGLATMRFDYKKRGMTKELLGRIEAAWDDANAGSFPEYKNKAFLEPTSEDINGFVKYHGGDQAEWVADILSGEKDLEGAGYGGYGNLPVDTLWDELPLKIQQRVGKWLIDNHPDEVEEWKEHNDKDFDGTDPRDTWTIIEEDNIEEVTNALERAMETGHQYGTELEMYNSLKDWLNDLPNDREMSVSLHPGIEKDWDSPQFLQIPEETMIDVVSEYHDELEHAGDLGSFFEFTKMDAPYNGWDGYDEKAAIERAEEELAEEGMLG